MNTRKGEARAGGGGGGRVVTKILHSRKYFISLLGLLFFKTEIMAYSFSYNVRLARLYSSVA